MRNSASPPVYSKVAFDIAMKIARGDLREGQIISGRSLTSSEYNVSPETVRRAFRLLSDMTIVDVQHNRGAIVLSKSNAAEYIKKFNNQKDMWLLKKELKALLSERNSINERLVEIVNQIIDVNERFRTSDPLRNFEFEIPENSPITGLTIADSMFWQNTGATIIAIRRNGNIILSPGPYAVFVSHDSIIVTGDTDITERVLQLISPTL